MTKRQQRLVLILAGLIALSVVTALVLRALESNVSFFYTPTQVSAGEAPKGKPFRMGGMVPVGSVQREPNSLNVAFAVTDNVHTVKVKYSGLLPDLFKEGKGVVVRGQTGADGIFAAQEVLAKHDENYMPPEAAAAMEAAKKAREGSKP